jgi:hypothetical protein
MQANLSQSMHARMLAGWLQGMREMTMRLRKG